MVASYFKLAEYPPLASLLLDHIRKEGHSTVPSNFNLGNLNFIVLVRCSLRLGRTRLRPHNQAGVTQSHIRSLTHYLLWSTLPRESCYLPWLSLLKWFLRTSSGQAPKQNVHLKPKVKFATKWKLQLVVAASLVLFCWFCKCGPMSLTSDSRSLTPCMFVLLAVVVVGGPNMPWQEMLPCHDKVWGNKY